MKNGKEIQQKRNKLEIYIEPENNNKINKNLDLTINNKKKNKRKNQIYTKSNGIKNKQLTTKIIFKTKNANNFQQIKYKNNSNPFRNSLNKSIEKTNKKKSNILNINKSTNENIYSNSSDPKPKKIYNKEKDIIKDIKNVVINNNEIHLKHKINIYENQIKQINIYNKQKYLISRETKNTKAEKEYIKKSNQSRKNNGKEDYINKNEGIINEKDTGINEDNYKKNKLENSKLRNKNILSKENGQKNETEKININNQKMKSNSNLINKNHVEYEINAGLKNEKENNKPLEIHNFQIIDNNINNSDYIDINDKALKNNIKNGSHELLNNNIKEKASLINNENFQNFNGNIYLNGKYEEIKNIKEKNTENSESKNNEINFEKKDSKSSCENNNIDKYNNDIINNGKTIINIIDSNENINRNSKDKTSNNFIESQNLINNLDDSNNGKKSRIMLNDELTYENNNIDKNRKNNILLNVKRKLTNENESNPVENILNNIQNLIFQSKNKIEKDLSEIQKMENSNVYQEKMAKKIKSNKKSKRKIIDNMNNNEMFLNFKKRRINQHKFNGRYITENFIKDNKSVEKDIFNYYENDNDKILFSKKNNNRINININQSYANQYKNNIKNESSYEIENRELSSRKDINNSVSKKKNKNSKYDDIDLNTLFSKSNKKIESNKNSKPTIKNFELKEENGGNINIFNEDDIENDDNIISEELTNENILGNEPQSKKIRDKKIIKKEFNQILNNKNIYDENKNIEKENYELIDINKKLINKITELKKEVEYTKKEMKKRDEKLLKFVNKYDKIATENALNKVEIENLEEELLNKKNESFNKTRKIKELTDKNIGLEQEMNQLKIYYEKKDDMQAIPKKIYKYYMKEFKNINNNSDNKNQNPDFRNTKNEEKMKTFEDLNVEELHNERNALIKERDEISIIYNKLPIKLVSKEQINQKIELEKRLKKINNNLMKIRLQLKSYNQ